jgi:hypothetical protein
MNKIGIARPTLLALLSISIFQLSSCKEKGCTNPNAVNYEESAEKDDGSCDIKSYLTLDLKMKVADEDLELGTGSYTNSAANAYKVERVLFYLSEITAHYQGGLSEEIAEYHYFDASAPATMTLTKKHVAHGKIDSLTFVFGMRGDLNKDYALPATTEHINMQWPTPMGGGYHYMKFEGKFLGLDAEMHNYNIHMGRLVNSMGSTDPMFTLTLPLDGKDVGAVNFHMEVAMDLDGWFTGEKPYNMEDYGEGIMMNHEAQALLRKNGMNDVFKLIKTWEERLD